MGTPSYKMRHQVMWPIIEKILARLKFDEDDDIITIFNNHTYFKALQIAENFHDSPAINLVR